MPSSSDATLADDDARSLFDGVAMIADRQLLRRVTLSLTARLPTSAERDAITADGLNAFPALLDALMREDAFYERLTEGFNDIFLTLGYNGNGEDVLAYNHFEKTRHWYQKHNLNHLPEKDRQRARYKLADQYREALRREPLELLRYIVSNDRPFTEMLTANYTMVSPYTSRGYGVFDELRDQFQNPDDPFEFIPRQLPALKHRDGKVQPTAEGLHRHVRSRPRRGRSAGAAALASAAVARRANGDRPAVRDRHDRTCLIHPYGPQSAAAAGRH